MKLYQKIAATELLAFGLAGIVNGQIGFGKGVEKRTLPEGITFVQSSVVSRKWLDN